MRSWTTFGARMNHGQTQTHMIHHGPDFGEANTFPLIVFFVLSHGANIQMSFCPKTPKLEFQNSLNWDSYDIGGLHIPKWGPILGVGVPMDS